MKQRFLVFFKRVLVAWTAMAALLGSVAWAQAQTQNPYPNNSSANSAPKATRSVGPASNPNNRIYRCGNEYTNNVQPDQKGCKLVEGGNVTVVTSPRESDLNRVTASTRAITRPSAEQERQRNAETRAILESELSRTQARQAELLREYNNGEPEKMGPEFRNHQKYLDRVSELKANIERNQSDIADLQREISRLPSPTK